MLDVDNQWRLRFNAFHGKWATSVRWSIKIDALYDTRGIYKSVYVNRVSGTSRWFARVFFFSVVLWTISEILISIVTGISSFESLNLMMERLLTFWLNVKFDARRINRIVKWKCVILVIDWILIYLYYQFKSFLNLPNNQQFILIILNPTISK